MYRVYLLKDPRTRAPRYVGITSRSINKRLRDHRSDKRHNHRTAWLQSLYKIGLEPIAEILEESEDNYWEDAEMAWILGFKQAGADLVNATDGGEGLNNPSQETREKIGQANMGRIISDETRMKMSLARKGRRPTEETKRKMSRAQMGNKNCLGYKRSEETRRKISEANIGRHRHHTEETKMRMSIAQKARRIREATQ
jgi:hypothetical protein